MLDSFLGLIHKRGKIVVRFGREMKTNLKFSGCVWKIGMSSTSSKSRVSHSTHSQGLCVIRVPSFHNYETLYIGK